MFSGPDKFTLSLQTSYSDTTLTTNHKSSTVLALFPVAK